MGRKPIVKRWEYGSDGKVFVGTSKQFAEHLGIQLNTLYSYVHKGVIKFDDVYEVKKYQKSKISTPKQKRVLNKLVLYNAMCVDEGRMEDMIKIDI